MASYTRLNGKRGLSSQQKQQIEIEKDYRTYYVFLDESSSYPYTLTINSTGISAINNDASNELTITLTYNDSTNTIAIPVPASTAFEGHFEDFYIITTSGSTNYNIGVRY